MAALPQQYAAVSLSNVAATTCQYDALKYVSFPVQTLGKCAKMIPVMIWGRLIMQKRYSLREYALAGAPLAPHRTADYILGSCICDVWANPDSPLPAVTLPKLRCQIWAGCLGPDFNSGVQSVRPHADPTFRLATVVFPAPGGVQAW